MWSCLGSCCSFHPPTFLLRCLRLCPSDSESYNLPYFNLLNKSFQGILLSSTPCTWSHFLMENPGLNTAMAFFYLSTWTAMQRMEYQSYNIIVESFIQSFEPMSMNQCDINIQIKVCLKSHMVWRDFPPSTMKIHNGKNIFLHLQVVCVWERDFIYMHLCICLKWERKGKGDRDSERCVSGWIEKCHHSFEIIIGQFNST